MKFVYEYRSSDNVPHRDVVKAANREAFFFILKDKGIRPWKVIEAPGFFNKLFGKGKRWMVIALLTVCVIGLSLLFVRREKMIDRVAESFDDTTRRQLIGDAAIIEKGIKTGWSDVFKEEGERFLASFAVPGFSASLRSTSESEIRAALGRKVGTNPNDGIESRQIKAMVEGMKDELRRFLAKDGSIAEYGSRLVQRQEEEIGYYLRAKREIESCKGRVSRQELESRWERVNDSLRKMGVRLVNFPD